MAESIDWAPYVEAGLLAGLGPEHQGRRDLLAFLISEGCGIEEMVAADGRGRLFGLAGDRILRPGARTLTLGQVAARLGADEALVRRLWRAFGLEGWDSDARIASPEDAEVLATAVLAAGVLGADPALAHARAIGAALSHIGGETLHLAGTLSASASVATSGSELDTARYWARTAPVLPAFGRMLDVLFRHHFELAREYFERSNSFDLMSRRMTRAAVGFLDMSGFTRTTEELDEADFSRLMASFGQLVNETVSDLGGRVVKLIGDAAMVVAPSPSLLAAIVDELFRRWSSSGEGLSLHAGLAYGELLCQDGDYFGRAVNLAARLVAVAAPGTMMASEPVGAMLAHADWIVEWQDPMTLRGISNPVVACVIRATAARGSD